MKRRKYARGPLDPEIVLVLDQITSTDLKAHNPGAGTGYYHNAFWDLAAQARILRTDIYVTYIAETSRSEWENAFLLKTPFFETGKKEVLEEIEFLQPKVVIAAGEIALQALTGEKGITKWRGSVMPLQVSDETFTKVIPTYNPLKLLRMYEWRQHVLADLTRTAREATRAEIAKRDYEQIIRPSLEDVTTYCGQLLLEADRHHSPIRVACDIETAPSYGVILCIGFCYNSNRALCIPDVDIENEETGNYWTEGEWDIIWVALQNIFRHPNIRLLGQNFQYDLQYLFKIHMLWPKANWHDTMLKHHVCFPGTKKSLDHLSSLYCMDYHTYWKDDAKDHETGRIANQELLWRYNCDDVVITLEVNQSLETSIEALDLHNQDSEQRAFARPIMEMSLRGVLVDEGVRQRMLRELSTLEVKLIKAICYITERDLNPKSPKQMTEYLYGTLGLKEQKKRGRRGGKSAMVPTADDEALTKLGVLYPALEPLFKRVLLYRSLGTVRANTLGARRDAAGRWHTSYNPAGTTTFRLSSSRDAFKRGLNLQNVTSGEGDIPNIRRCIIPDPGYIIAPMDLDRADLQVVVWEAGVEDLKTILRSGVDVHKTNAATVLEKPSDSITYYERQRAKGIIHATNYGAKPPTLAKRFGITRAAAQRFQDIWFDRYPEIRDWHVRIKEEILTRGTVTNIFGYTWRIQSRLDDHKTFNEALAWKPQSTIGLLINKILLRVRGSDLCRPGGEMDEIESGSQAPIHDSSRDSLRSREPTGRSGLLLPAGRPRCIPSLQVHDEIVWQILRQGFWETLEEIERLALIEIPYDDPLVIPVGFKLPFRKSKNNWGDLEEVGTPAEARKMEELSWIAR